MNDRNRPNIRNIGSVTIVQSRGFHVGQNVTFQAESTILENFQPTRLNVAAIGNKTPQLHLHIIARYEGDPAWPGTVWDHPVRAPYSSDEKQKMVALLSSAFKLLSS